jgi:hypothetical protein
MNTMRCAVAGALIGVLSVNSVASVTIDELIADEPSPYWVEGGSYTAEVDLSTARLKLFPLTGDAVEISLSGACVAERAQGALPEGVYVLLKNADGFDLRASHYQGDSLLDVDARTLASCQNLNAAGDLSLPHYALNLLEAYDVGALYLHR